MSKVYENSAKALDGLLFDGMTIMSGGFGLCGIPENLIDAIAESGVQNITAISNNPGTEGSGLGKLIKSGQITKMIASYVGENRYFEERYINGDIELEFSPQGTLAERIRAGGAGIPAFYVKTGVGTLVAEGKEVKIFNNEEYILEKSLFADLSIVKAYKGDTEGNLTYRKTARNFNPNMATASYNTVAEVEQLVNTGEIKQDEIHTPGIFVKRILQGVDYKKEIEKITTLPRVNN